MDERFYVFRWAVFHYFNCPADSLTTEGAHNLYLFRLAMDRLQDEAFITRSPTIFTHYDEWLTLDAFVWAYKITPIVGIDYHDEEYYGPHCRGWNVNAANDLWEELGELQMLKQLEAILNREHQKWLQQ
jgi:hypothetical protein